MSEQKKILVVEDDPDLQRGLAIRLRADGYRVMVAADALQATTAVLRQSPDLAILDLKLPGGSGFDVLRRCIAFHRCFVPVIVLTAVDPAVAERQALELGATAFFQKPADNRDLLACISWIFYGCNGRDDDLPIQG
jgi:two-component system, OmpR family, KDP operon response regulator KdpE